MRKSQEHHCPEFHTTRDAKSSVECSLQTPVHPYPVIMLLNTDTHFHCTFELKHTSLVCFHKSLHVVLSSAAFYSGASNSADVTAV